MINVMLLLKRYSGNYPLRNEMVKLDPKRFRVVVCYLGGRPDDNNELDSLVDKVYYLQLPNKALRWYNFSLIKTLLSILDREKIDLLHSHLYRTTALGVLTSRLAKSRPALISTLHGLGSAGTWKRRLANRFLYRYVDRLTGVSDAVAEDVRRNSPFLCSEKVIAIRNGLLLDDYLTNLDKTSLRKGLFPQLHDGVWFGTVGRLSAVKNQLRLLEAFGDVSRDYPHARLLMVGKGDLESELRSRVERDDLEDRVFFAGYRNDIERVLKTLDVFMLPSLREGLPLSMIEAMASGVPVIASAVGGIPELVGEGRFARLVASDDVAALAAAMKEFCAMEDAERAELGAEARQRAISAFSSSEMIRGYEDVYQQVVTEQNGNIN